MRPRHRTTIVAATLLLAAQLGTAMPVGAFAAAPTPGGRLDSVSSSLPPADIAAAGAVVAEPDVPAAPPPDNAHDHAADGNVHFRKPTPAELKALGLVEGTGPCAGMYESFPRSRAPEIDRHDNPGVARVCSHGPDFLDLPANEPAAINGGDPAYVVYGSGPYVHVYYGYLSGTTSRLPSLKPFILESVARADDIYARSAAQVGRVRHVRWKMSSCQLVVTAVALPSSVLLQTYPGPIRSYLMSHGQMTSGEKGLIFTDEGSCSGSGIAGIAELAIDERASTSNDNNQGGMLARVFGCYWSTPDTMTYAGDVAAHEVTHTMGAVGDNAPNSSSRTGGRSHCTDGDDVMCYNDGGGEPRAICAAAYPAYLDCRKDDYFSPVPAAGSYIATHWNTASNQFLAASAPTAEQALPHPTSTLTLPSASTAVSGLVNLAANATAGTDGSAIIQVEFWANGNLVDIDDT
ncbi:MAG: hypothetical protein ABIV26_01720, partial [Candidatus Limnocylindrales bacterium]